MSARARPNGNLFRDARLRLGLSAQQVADDAGVHINSVFAAECGARKPTRRVAEALARTLDLDLDLPQPRHTPTRSSCLHRACDQPRVTRHFCSDHIRIDTLPIPDLPDEPSEDWHEQAACRHHPTPDLWFQAGFAGLPSEVARICADCPVRGDCLLAGLNEPEGVWGGLSGARRDKVRRMLRRKAAA